jgi:RNA polymerase sigma-70 factor (family 1)
MDIERNDKVLTTRIAEGDEAAFTQLFYTYLPLIKSIVFKLTKDDNAVEDLVQDIFLKIWLTREQLPDIENLRGWILRLAYNTTFNWIRTKKVRSVVITGIPDEEKLPVDTDVDPASLEQTRTLIANAIDQLPKQAHKIYQLNRQYGYSITEIATKMNLAPQTVKNTLGRAVKAIRDHLKMHGLDLPLILMILLLRK